MGTMAVPIRAIPLHPTMTRRRHLRHQVEAAVIPRRPLLRILLLLLKVRMETLVAATMMTTAIASLRQAVCVFQKSLENER